jgi:hypothetical protein
LNLIAIIGGKGLLTLIVIDGDKGPLSLMSFSEVKDS